MKKKILRARAKKIFLLKIRYIAYVLGHGKLEHCSRSFMSVFQFLRSGLPFWSFLKKKIQFFPSARAKKGAHAPKIFHKICTCGGVMHVKYLEHSLKSRWDISIYFSPFFLSPQGRYVSYILSQYVLIIWEILGARTTFFTCAFDKNWISLFSKLCQKGPLTSNIQIRTWRTLTIGRVFCARGDVLNTVFWLKKFFFCARGKI